MEVSHGGKGTAEEGMVGCWRRSGALAFVTGGLHGMEGRGRMTRWASAAYRRFGERKSAGYSCPRRRFSVSPSHSPICQRSRQKYFGQPARRLDKRPDAAWHLGHSRADAGSITLTAIVTRSLVPANRGPSEGVYPTRGRQRAPQADREHRGDSAPRQPDIQCSPATPRPRPRHTFALPTDAGGGPL